jgi:transposase InsO family protein
MHPNARLSEHSRRLLVERIEAGWSAASAAEAMGVSRATAYKWADRYRTEGVAGLRDRSCRPHASPRRLAADQELAIVQVRQQRKLGPHRLAALTGVPRSTCYAVLRRYGLPRLADLDRPTGRVVRRYQFDRPGGLGHLDVKKLGRIPDGGGHRLLGRSALPKHRRRLGYDYIHSLVDDCSRLAYSEVLADEQGPTCADFMRRAQAFFASHGIRFERIMTDNAWGYVRSAAFRAVLAELGSRQLRTPPYTPRVNGKVERFNRTLLEEWAYVRLYTSNHERTAALTAWLHRYNYHRAHTALGGRPPITRVNNLSGHYN